MLEVLQETIKKNFIFIMGFNKCNYTGLKINIKTLFLYLYLYINTFIQYMLYFQLSPEL